MKFWEVFGSFWWAVGTLFMAYLYRTGPDKSVERLSIGRRCSIGRSVDERCDLGATRPYIFESIAARRFGFLNPVHTTNFLPVIQDEGCTGCGRCVNVCPVEAMSLISANNPHNPQAKKAVM